MIRTSISLIPPSIAPATCYAPARAFASASRRCLTAAARAVGIPARRAMPMSATIFTSKRLQEQVGDTFYWHSYTELQIDGKWVKCTPAFDQALCERAKVVPLDFDGVNDSLLSSRSIRSAAAIWNICRIAAHSPTCRSRPSWPTSGNSIRGWSPRAPRRRASATKSRPDCGRRRRRRCCERGACNQLQQLIHAREHAAASAERRQRQRSTPGRQAQRLPEPRFSHWIALLSMRERGVL